jgi:general secretion pathway protein D
MRTLAFKHSSSLAVLLGVSLLGSALTAHGQFPGFGGSGFGGSSRSSSASARQYNNNGTIGDAIISIDPETRRIIVITDEETSEHVSQVITNLDRPKPQVLINVVFLEVTYAKGLDIGVEGSYLSPNQQFGYKQDFSGMPGIPGVSGQQGKFSYVNPQGYSATLKALATTGKMEVLSRPSIMARNNQQATILVGKQVPLITSVRYDTFGNQMNGITYQNVGIQLVVTPFITSSGMVEMIVAPSISAISSETVAISTTTNNSTVGAPVINTRSADTVVVTPDGHTVIIGGLMQNEKSDNVSKVPLLGDIPGLGYLFRRTVKTSAKTELMIFLTPHIVLNPVRMDEVTEHGKATLQKAFTEQDLNKFLEGIPTKNEPTAVTKPGQPTVQIEP